MFRSASRASDDTTCAQHGALRQPGELLASKRMGGGDTITSGDGGLGAFVPVTSTAPQARPSGKLTLIIAWRDPCSASGLSTTVQQPCAPGCPSRSQSLIRPLGRTTPLD